MLQPSTTNLKKNGRPCPSFYTLAHRILVPGKEDCPEKINEFEKQLKYYLTISIFASWIKNILSTRSANTC